MHSLHYILTNPNYFAPSWVFLSLNLITGTWVLYLPHVKIKLALNDANIGFALFCLALGIFLAIPFVPLMAKKIGLGRLTKLGILFFALLFNIPLFSYNYIFLCLSLFLIGIFSGITDVAMNALVSVIEKKDGKNFMSAAHGFFSLGGFLGAGLGSLYLAFFESPSIHMLIISTFVILSNLVLSKYYNQLTESKFKIENIEKRQKVFRPLLGLAVVAFIIMCSEGAVEHWSNLFLFDVVGVEEGKAGTGFILFSLMMTIGRFLGDHISKRMGSFNIIINGCFIAIGGYLLIITTHFGLSILGFGLLGLGLSVIIPELFRIAGNTPGISSSEAISFISGIGFIGFMLGPVLLGLISNNSNLILSYIFLAITTVIALALVQFNIRTKYR
jgi:fucose permease